MKQITVFTPTFNRAYCLHQLYDSLVRQDSQDFVWMVIDDGSTDDTKSLVARWIAEQKIQIVYIYQENQGMHGGHNTAYKNITTPLNVCIDSDDYMPDDAIGKILELWEREKKPQYAGIVGLDAFKSGAIVGTKIPEGIHDATLAELYGKYGVKGDKKVVLQTAVVREFPPYPIFENERLVPLGTLYLMIEQRYRYLCSNDVYCIVEYLPDGSSNNILRQYRKSPRGFGYARKVRMGLSKSTKEQFKNAVHLVSSSLFARENLVERTQIPIAILAAPFGVLLHFYIRFKTRNT